MIAPEDESGPTAATVEPALRNHAPGSVSPVDRFVEALRRRGIELRGNMARCPAHDDTSPSLSLGVGRDGTVLLHCFAGCSVEQVVAAVGLQPRDLFALPLPRRSRRSGGGGRPARPARPVATIAPPRPRETWPDVDEATAALAARLAFRDGEAVEGATARFWDYFDRDGQHAGRVLRVDLPGAAKQVRPLARLDDGRWSHTAMREPRPLYALRELIAAPSSEPTFVVEGERCGDALRDLGFVATTSSGGARAASRTDWQPMHGRVVAIWPDHDVAGIRFARDVHRLALAAGAAAVRVLAMPVRNPGDDCIDWADRRRAGGWTDDDLRDAIGERLAIVLEEVPR